MAKTTPLFSNIRNPSERVRAICRYGCNVEVDNSIPPKRYFRSGREMLRMATVYLDEGELESAFILFSKFLTLFFEKLPEHPEYKLAPSLEIAENKKKIRDIFPLAEKIKKSLLKKYEQEESIIVKEEKRRHEVLAKEQERLRKEEEDKRKYEELKEKQLRVESEERWLREQEEKYRSLQEQERKKLELKEYDKSKVLLPGFEPPPPVEQDGASLNNRKSAVAGGGSLHFVPNDLSKTKLEKNVIADNTNISVPNIPDKDFKNTLIINENLSPGSVPIPLVDRTTKPKSDHFTSIGGVTDNRHGLRDLFVPKDLMVKFVNLAQSNSSQNIETCGILGGKLAQKAFHITHLIIPKQIGTPDRCEMQSEAELFDYQDQHDLITLGWIHTHPSQTAFLSSVDLHTQYPYQQMLPEAIAIVCSIKFNETGIFMLTPEKGMPEVGGCLQRGHHEHQKHPPLFETCGHVRIQDDKPVIIGDLRGK